MKKEKNYDFIFIVVLVLIIVLLALGLTKAIMVGGEVVRTEIEAGDVDQYADMTFEGESYLMEIGQNSEQIAESIRILEGCGIHSITKIREISYEPHDYPQGVSYFLNSDAPEVYELIMELDKNKDLKKVSGSGYLLYYDNEVIMDVEPLVITEKEREKADKKVIKETKKQYPKCEVVIDKSSANSFYKRTMPQRDYFESRGLVEIKEKNGNIIRASYKIDFAGSVVKDFSLNEY